MKTIGIFNMIAAYICSIISIAGVTYYVAFEAMYANAFILSLAKPAKLSMNALAFEAMYANAFILSLAGFAMFMIAETLKKEWRQGKL